MQKGKFLHFSCLNCANAINFSVFDLKKSTSLTCSECSQPYQLNDPILVRQIKKFEDLCKQIQISEEILSESNIGINVGNQQVKIPYKILLTRLNTSLNLKIGEKEIKIDFRMEPNNLVTGV